MEEREYKEIGARMNRMRHMRRIKLKDVAAETGIPMDRLVIYERGIELPTELEMLKISQAIHVHWDKIIFPGGKRYRV